MFRRSLVVCGRVVRAVVPIVKNFVTRLRDVGVVLLPDSHGLGLLNQIIAGTLNRYNIREACFNCRRAGRGGAVCVRVGYLVPPGARCASVVCVNDRGVAPVGTLKPHPALHNAYYFLPCLRFRHAASSFLAFLVKLRVLLTVACPFLSDGFALVLRFFKLQQNGVGSLPDAGGQSDPFLTEH